MADAQATQSAQVNTIPYKQELISTVASEDKKSIVKTLTVTINVDQLNLRLATINQQIAAEDVRHLQMLASFNSQIQSIQDELAIVGDSNGTEVRA
jgi:hypothetical protein